MISTLIVSSYLDFPPRTGGLQHMLAAYMDLQPEDGIQIEYIFLAPCQEKADFIKQSLVQYPCISDAMGICNSDKKMDASRRPSWFSEDVWHRLNDSFIETLIKTVTERHYDIIQIEHSQMAWVVPFLRNASPHSKLILDLHNIEWMIYQRSLSIANRDTWLRVNAKNEFKALKLWEETVWPWFDAIMTLSPLENQKIKALLPQMPTIEVPPGGGMDMSYFESIQEAVPLENQEIIFIGNLEWFPNLQGISWFLEEIFPKIIEKKADVHLNIVGSGTPPMNWRQSIEDYDNVIFSGEVRDVRPLMRRGKVFVIPLLIGAGARIKMLDAWAFGIPIVSTHIGAEGLPVSHGENVMLADNASDFANAVLQLLDEESLSLRVKENGLATINRHFTREIFLNRLKDGYRNVLSRNTHEQ